MKTRKPHWSAAEDWLLEDLAGTDRLPAIYQRYCQIAKEKGWHVRSQAAFKTRCWSLGLSTEPTENNLSICELARQLGFTEVRIRGWIKRYPSELHKRQLDGSPVCRISIDEFKSFAKRHAHLLWDADKTGLAGLVGRQSAALITQNAHKLEQRKSIYCVETRMVYGSSYDAARRLMTAYDQRLPRRLDVMAAKIRCALKTGRIAYGYHWQYVNQREVAA